MNEGLAPSLLPSSTIYCSTVVEVQTTWFPLILNFLYKAFNSCKMNLNP